MKAWIQNNAVRDVCHGDPATSYHPDIAALYDTDVPDGTVIGATLIDGVWTNPVIPEVVPVDPQPVIIPPVRILSKLAYMDRFTDDELADIYTMAKTVVQVEVWLEKFRLAAEVDLDDPRTIAGVQALESAGLLATGRAAEILA